MGRAYYITEVRLEIDLYKKENPVLSSIMQKVFLSRDNFPVEYLASLRKEIVNNMISGQLWFISGGCSHEKKGGCTMCNYGYGKGFNFSQNKILDSIKECLDMLGNEHVHELVIGPTGSFLDDDEVSPDLRNEIYTLLSSVNFEKLYFETRCDTISFEKLKNLRNYLNKHSITIEIGLECTNDWILRNCINKRQMLHEVQEILPIIHDMNIRTCANISIGIPFISEKMGIDLAVKSVGDAFEMGFDEVVIFPYHIKPGTLLEMLDKHNLYTTISLWALVDTLYHIPECYIDRLNIAWYKNYYGKKSPLILKSPTTCSSCEENIIMLLDEFKNKPSRNLVVQMYEMSCSCRQKWEKKIDEEHLTQCAPNFEAFQKAAELFDIDYSLIEDEINYMKKTWVPL